MLSMPATPETHGDDIPRASEEKAEGYRLLFRGAGQMDKLDELTLEHIRARFASPATPQDVREAVKAFKEGFEEWDS